MNKPLVRLMLLLGVGWMVFGTGCATPRIDWNLLVGSYSYDQAVLDLGPPDRVASLADGTRVAEWLTSRGRGYGTVHTFGPPFPYHYRYHGGPMVYHYTEPAMPDYYIRLIFSPEGILERWQRVSR